MSFQYYFRSMIRFASVLLLILTTRAIALAQNQEVLITVSGPWAYMQDPYNKERIVIMAPDLTGHGHLPAQIHPAPDGQKASLPHGQYELIIANKGTCDEQAPQGAEEKAHLFPLVHHLPPRPKGDKTIENAITTEGPRFAISLPKPCYYSSWHVGYSIVTEQPITIKGQDATGDPYTTEMVLHYFVTSVAPATWISKPDGGKPSSTSKVEFLMNRIEIDVRSNRTAANNILCDTMSAASFRAEINPFKPPAFHTWFPELVDDVQTAHYDDSCKDKFEADKGIVTPGSADCQSGQSSVDGTGG